MAGIGKLLLLLWRYRFCVPAFAACNEKGIRWESGTSPLLCAPLEPAERLLPLFVWEREGIRWRSESEDLPYRRGIKAFED